MEKMLIPVIVALITIAIILAVIASMIDTIITFRGVKNEKEVCKGRDTERLYYKDKRKVRPGKGKSGSDQGNQRIIEKVRDKVG